MKFKTILFGVILLISISMCSAENSTISASDIMGDPLTAFEPVKEPVKFVTGFALAVFIVVCVVGVFVGGSSAGIGDMIKSVGMREHGSSSVVRIVSMVLLVSFSLMIFWYVIEKFLL